MFFGPHYLAYETLLCYHHLKVLLVHQFGANHRMNMAIKILLYAVLTCPLLISFGTIYPFVLGRTLLFRVIVELCLGLFLLMLCSGKVKAPSISKLMTLVFGCFLFQVVVTVLSVDPWRSVWSTQERMAGLITGGHFAVYFLLLCVFIRTDKEWFCYFCTALGISDLVALFGIFQWTNFGDFSVFNWENVFSTLGNPIFFGGYAAIHVCLALFLLVKYPPQMTATTSFLYLSAGLNMMAVVLARARGPLLALGTGLIVLFLLFTLTRKSRFMRNALICGILVIVIGLGGLLFYFNLTTFDRLDDFFDLKAKYYTASTAEIRLILWEIALKSWLQKPLTGWGPENFQAALLSNLDLKLYEIKAAEIRQDRVHNKFLGVLCEQGLPGLLFYLALLLLPTLIILKNTPFRRAGLQPGHILLITLVVYCVYLFFAFETLATLIFFNMFLAYCHSLSRGTGIEQDDYAQYNPEDSRHSLFSLCVTASTMVLVSLLVTGNYLQLVSSHYTYMASTFVKSEPEYAIVYLKKALDYPSPYLREPRNELMNATTILMLRKGDVAPDESFPLMDFVRRELFKEKADHAFDVTLLNMYAQWNVSMAESYSKEFYLDEARKTLDRALTISPQHPQALYTEGNYYLLKHDVEKALASFQKVVELAPASNVAHWHLGIYYAKVRQFTMAYAELYHAINGGLKPTNKFELMWALRVFDYLGDLDGVNWVYNRVEQLGWGAFELACIAQAYTRLERLEQARHCRERALQMQPEQQEKLEQVVQAHEIPCPY